MLRRLLSVLFIFISFQLSSQIRPENGSILNYRLVGFNYMIRGKCTLEVAIGNYTDSGEFKKNIVTSGVCRGTVAVAEVPYFGTEYTWRVKRKGSENRRPYNTDKTSPLYHFKTAVNDDSGKVQFRIISSTGDYDSCYIVVDATNTIYDMHGKPVWLMPASDPFRTEGGRLRDMKVTPYGSMTFIAGERAREIDCNGNAKWKGPTEGSVNGDTSEHFHHELTRLPNGHYMVLGNEVLAIRLPNLRKENLQPGDSAIVQDVKGNFYQKVEFGTVIEYDHDSVVWSWTSSDYFKKSDLYNHYLPDGRLPIVDVHENAFYFDEERHVIYVGFRDVSRIIKIKYPEGNILAVYGTISERGKDELGTDQFCGQHSIRVAQNGDICLYDNNSFDFSDQPKVVVLRERGDNNNSLKKIWEYTCTTDGMNENERDSYNRKTEQIQALGNRDIKTAKTTRFSSGGNVIELQDGSFFVSMSGDFGKAFIVSRNKKILWSGVPEIKIFPGAPWSAVATYRSCIISRQDMEALVLSGR